MMHTRSSFFYKTLLHNLPIQKVFGPLYAIALVKILDLPGTMP